MDDEALAAWRAPVDEAFSYLEPAGWAAALCEEKIDSPPAGTAYVKLSRGQGAAVAATIAGECGKQTGAFGGNTTYLYKFVGFVKNPQIGTDDVSINFKLTVSGPSGSADLLTNGTKSLQPGETFSIQNRQAFVQLSENEYDKICVHFENPPEFYTSNTVCNTIVCQDLGSSGYEVPPELINPDPVDPSTTTTSGSTTSGSSGTIWGRI